MYANIPSKKINLNSYFHIVLAFSDTNKNQYSINYL